MSSPPFSRLLVSFPFSLRSGRRLAPVFAICLLFCAVVLAPRAGLAQTAGSGAAAPLGPSSSTSASNAASPVPAKIAAPKAGWSLLTPLQQQALKPLASQWDSISEGQKRKWLEISKNYPSLPPEDQTKMHSRMTDWVSLSAQERAQARFNFGKTAELSKELTAEEKKAKWEAYQLLSAEEKKSLVDKASRKAGGAAPAIRPVAPQMLATVPTPANKQSANPAPRIMPSQRTNGSAQPAAAGASSSPPASPR